MLTDLQRDILIKSAEGIQEGMWCTGEWFTNSPQGDMDDKSFLNVLPDDVFDGQETLLNSAQIDNLTKLHRCAEGELMLRTLMLGGTQSDYIAVERAVHGAVVDLCDRCSGRKDSGRTNSFDVSDHNDTCMSGLDPFTAGQQWSDIFRSLL